MTDNYLRNAGRMEWPENETAIDNTGINGEVPDSETHDIGGVLYRVNPAGNYALYFGGKGRGWRESACVTNDMIKPA